MSAGPPPPDDLWAKIPAGHPRPSHSTPSVSRPGRPPGSGRAVGRSRQLRELSPGRVRYGYRRLHALLRREGRVIIAKRVYRAYGLERPTLRRKNLRRRVGSRRRGDRPAVGAARKAWAMVFMSDALADGRKLRVRTVIDLFNRESPAIRAGTRFTSGQVAEILAGVALGRGVPRELRVDNGPESTGKMLDLWACLHRVPPDFSRLGQPADNAFIGSLNGRLTSI